MTQRAHTVLTLVLLALLAMAVWRVHTLCEIRDELIELNHNKSVFIDNSECAGQFHGTEETR